MADTEAKAVSAKLEKAVFMVKMDGGDAKKLPVQFNPSQLQLSRSVKINRKTGVGRDDAGEAMDVASGGIGTLKVTLLFDAYSAYGTAQPTPPPPEPAPAALDKKVVAAVNGFKALVRYAPELHSVPKVTFVWGENLNFEGKVASISTRYTMFETDGTPVRAELEVEIWGEDKHEANARKNMPFESPDRTKSRFLPYGEQLWLLAGQEYGDPGQWKAIADANGILNPRAVNRARTVRVPSIRNTD